MNNEVKSIDRNPESSEVEFTVATQAVVAVSPEMLADAFWCMDDEQQCAFLDRLSFIADRLPFQLQGIIDCGQLSPAGRRVMQMFGEYGDADAMLAQRAKGE